MQAFTLATLLVVLLAGSAHAQTVGGAYTVGGTNPNGPSYSGTAEITTSGSTCRIVWQTGPTTSHGVCMVSNKSVAAFYKLGTDFGRVVYELKPDGTLSGYWSIVDKDGVGGEVLTPKR